MINKNKKEIFKTLISFGLTVSFGPLALYFNVDRSTVYFSAFTVFISLLAGIVISTISEPLKYNQIPILFNCFYLVVSIALVFVCSLYIHNLDYMKSKDIYILRKSKLFENIYSNPLLSNVLPPFSNETNKYYVFIVIFFVIYLLGGLIMLLFLSIYRAYFLYQLYKMDDFYKKKIFKKAFDRYCFAKKDIGEKIKYDNRKNFALKIIIMFKVSIKIICFIILFIIFSIITFSLLLFILYLLSFKLGNTALYQSNFIGNLVLIIYAILNLIVYILILLYVYKSKRKSNKESLESIINKKLYNRKLLNYTLNYIDDSYNIYVLKSLYKATNVLNKKEANPK